MTINAKNILKKIAEQERDRGQVTLYLSKSLLNDFKKHCGGTSASMVIEELMREFVMSAKNNTYKPKGK